MSARQEKVRLVLNAHRDSLMAWFAPEDGDEYPAFDVDAALAEVEEWETRQTVDAARVAGWTLERKNLIARAEAAEAEAARLREALREIASCEARVPGDVVNVARAALGETP